MVVTTQTGAAALSDPLCSSACGLLRCGGEALRRLLCNRADAQLFELSERIPS